ncbi:NADPH:quinone oxidoreductase [Vitis vinifera]|uniref:NAD(P)H dehydrogenase (quinone) n=1 Tax=Vitis vinifera TaxID=29760 RepID=A0A438GAY5_VITVI|nr:NADPH:quinone oxidoreductase [Vitis vinifera]
MAASKSVINVAALCGSLCAAPSARLPSTAASSATILILVAAMKLSKEAIEGMEIEYVDISPLPLLNTDLIVGGKFPPAVEAFGQQILKADGVLFATAENNFSVSGILSFASSFHPCWASIAPNAWADKPAAIISAGGTFGGGLSQ